MVIPRKRLEGWKWYPFTRQNIDLVPENPGVYCLGRNSHIIYIGSSNNLNQRLNEHYHTTDPCINKAESFAIDPRSDYREKERELLEWYLRENGRLPMCNDRI